MRQYIVRAGDTPTSIASRDDMAGCPKCVRDLVAANPHKQAVHYPNGFATFRELFVDEKLNLPDKWFDGTLDRMPSSYFESLPEVPTGLSGVGVGDYPAIDVATTSVSVLDTMDDRAFTVAADLAANAVDMAISEIHTTGAAASARYAQDARTMTALARQRNRDMAEAIAVGNQPEVASARWDVRQALTTAIGSARLALQSYYGAPSSLPAPAPAPIVASKPVENKGISTGAVFGVALLIAGAVGGAAYYITRTKRRVRRVYDDEQTY